MLAGQVQRLLLHCQMGREMKIEISLAKKRDISLKWPIILGEQEMLMMNQIANKIFAYTQVAEMTTIL